MLKKILLLLTTILLIQFCKTSVNQNSDTTAIYALLADSLIREFNKDSLSLYIQNITHMEYQYRGFNETLFSYFKYDLPETDSTLVTDFVDNNLKPVPINVSEIIGNTFLSKTKVFFKSDNPIDLLNDNYFYAMNLKFSAPGFTKDRLGAAVFYEMRINKKNWKPGGEIGYFLFKNSNAKWQTVNKRITNFIN